MCLELLCKFAGFLDLAIQLGSVGWIRETFEQVLCTLAGARSSPRSRPVFPAASPPEPARTGSTGRCLPPPQASPQRASRGGSAPRTLRETFRPGDKLNPVMFPEGRQQMITIIIIIIISIRISIIVILLVLLL